METLKKISGLSEDQILAQIPDPAGVFYRFTMAMGTQYKKFTEAK
jgi:hypothetical protein